MKMEVKQKGDVTVIEFEGCFTKNLGDYKIKNTITDLLNNGVRKILLQLSEVEFINSAGIGELVGAYISVSNRGGKLKLCGIPDKVYKMLKVTQLISIFDTYKTMEEALDSF
jgi:anti-sigma B factor antagonist